MAGIAITMVANDKRWYIIGNNMILFGHKLKKEL
jgi:hypothetical protein